MAHSIKNRPLPKTLALAITLLAMTLPLTSPLYAEQPRIDGSTEANWEASVKSAMDDMDDNERQALFSAITKLGSLRVVDELGKPVAERKNLMTRMREASDGLTVSEILAGANGQQSNIEKLSEAPADASLKEALTTDSNTDASVLTPQVIPQGIIDEILATLLSGDKTAFEQRIVMPRSEFDFVIKVTLTEAPEKIRNRALGNLDKIYLGYREDLLSSWQQVHDQFQQWGATSNNTRIVETKLKPDRRARTGIGPMAQLQLAVDGQIHSIKIGPFQTTESGKNLPIGIHMR